MTEETLFADALKQPTPEARRVWLDTTCADNPALRQRLEALLKSHDDAGSFLAAAAAVEAADPDGVDAEGSPGNRNTPVSEPTLAETSTSAPSDLAFLGPSTTPGSLGRLAHYEVLQVLGQGGFGVVLKARDTVLERVVAIKVMSGPMVSAGTARKRFIREAQAAAAICHDNVVTIHEVKQDDLPYLVMQYIHGCTLQDKLDRAGPLELKEILRIGMQIASGLAAAHAQGFLHRDIKPANILLENGVERVKITDFGLARAVDDASVTQSGVIAGTPQYMSPEQAQGEAVDHRADLFSLGSVLYALCTGHPPFRASGSMAVLKRVIEDTPRPARQSNPEIPEWLEAIIAKLQAKRREDRFQTAAEVAQLLGQHLAHVQQPSVAPKPEPVTAPTSAATAAVPSATGGESSWPTALLVLYAVFGLLFTLVIALFSYHGSSGRLFANWPADTAAGLLAVSALFLALVARRSWASAASKPPAIPTSSTNAATTSPAAERPGVGERLVRLGGGVLWAGMLFCYIFAVLAALAGLADLRAPASFLAAAGLCAATALAAFIVGRRWGGWCSRPGAIWLNAGGVLMAVALAFGAAWHWSNFAAPLVDGGAYREPQAPPAPQSHIDDLRRLIDLRKEAVELAKQRVAALVAPPNDVTVAEIDLIEAQIRLAEAEKNPTVAAHLGTELIQRHEQRLEYTKTLFELGRITAAEVNKVEQDLIGVRVRFPKAKR